MEPGNTSDTPRSAFEQLIDGGADLIINVDCGTFSHEPIARTRDRLFCRSAD